MMHNKQSRNGVDATKSAQPKMDKHFLESQGQSVQKKSNTENKTGLPDNLKAGLEASTGMDMSDTKVHYNSDKPAQLNAHAYAQGTDIYLASGKEHLLPHEAAHVVQQKEGKVQANTQVNGVGVNDNPSLEKNADEIGARALSVQASPTQLKTALPASPTVQRVGQIRFTNINGGAQAKAQTVEAQLLESAEVRAYLADKDCVIRLENPVMNTLTPAEVIQRGGQVQVSIAPWFFDTSGVGEIVGMLAHEFAVHPMGDWHLGAHGMAAEGHQSAHGAHMDSHYHKPKFMGLGTGAPYELWDDGQNQQDHLFMAKKDEGRALYYRGVTFELAAGILRRIQQGAQDVTLTDLEHLVISYLGDVATTVVTNDHKNNAGGVSKLDLLAAINQVMEYWREECNARGHIGAAVWQRSCEWIGGVKQALAFKNKQANSANHVSTNVNNVETFQHINNGYSDNQRATMGAMSWNGNPLEISDQGKVGDLITVMELGSGANNVDVAAAQLLANLTSNSALRVCLKVMNNPGSNYPNDIDLETISFLGQVYQMEVSILEQNGKINVLTQGAGKAVFAHKQNGSFALVHTS